MTNASLPSLLPYPKLFELRKIFKDQHRFTRSIVDSGLTTFGARWAAEFEELLQRLFPTESSLVLAARGYATFAMNSMRLQAEFERSGVYRDKSFAEAATALYFNEDRMMHEYLPGLQLSHYLWPHHYRQLKYFDQAFAEPMRLAAAKEFIEVGIGTGLYSQRLLRQVPDSEGIGFDISASSKAFAEFQMNAFGVQSRYQIKLTDFAGERLNTPTEWLVCVEVLEHLDDPLSFLAVLRKALKMGGSGFITTAINAAHEDHIYLYRSAQAVADQILGAGFTIEQYFLATAYAPPNVGVQVPEAVAFVVH
jgi:hypothetical protein